MNLSTIARKITLCVSSALLSLSLYSTSASAQLTSAEIVANAMCYDCIQWRPSGICFWMTCTLVGCDFDFSIRYSHFIPEAVVTAYSSQAPWPPFATDSNGVVTQGNAEEAPNDPSHLEFKHVDAMGSPAILSFSALAKSDFWCPTNITVFQPFFKSSLDFLGWRSGIPEIFYPQSWMGLFAPVIGRQMINNWGQLYPRHGFIAQMEDPKAAAVAAQRTADIVTRRYQPHIYWPMPKGKTNCGDSKRCWPPGAARINNSRTHTWQMLHPRMEQRCDIFGRDRNYANGRYTDMEQYAWHLWRPWSCCTREGMIFLGAFTTLSAARGVQDQAEKDWFDGKYGDPKEVSP